MPKISILIPVFNREKLISDSILSALNQNFEDFEIIVVDNASDDGTWDICQAFASQYPRVHVFRNETNIGPVRNWMRCIEEARGEYGKFLFSDDLMLPSFLSKTVPLIMNPKVAFVTTAAYIGQNIEHGHLNYANISLSETVSSVDYFKRLARGFPAVPYSPGAALFRMSDLRSNLLLNIPSPTSHDFNCNGAGPDVLIFALTAKKYDTVIMINEPLVFFRAHPGSFTIENSKNSVTEGYFLALAWFFREYSTPKNWAAWASKIWLIKFKKARAIINPFNISRVYSGSGSSKEVLQMICEASRFILIRLFKRHN